MSAQHTVEEVCMKGIEKRYQPSRCYMFILQVKWSDNTQIIIYRSYSAFFELHTQLLDLFPIEGGTIDEKERVIPFLPDLKIVFKKPTLKRRSSLRSRKIFQRTEVLKVAQERQTEIENYCKSLILLPEKISKHPSVIEFFKTKPDDINPPKSATKKSELVNKILSTFFKGYKKKTERSTSEELGDISGPLQCEQYVAIADYTSKTKTALSFKAGDVLEVVDKNANGWWFVQLDMRQGWAPASYLDPVDDSPDQDEAEPCLGERFVTVNPYKACFEDEISFETGVIVEVMNKALDGWWVVNYNGTVGHAPSTFLKPYENPFLDVKGATLPNPAPTPIANNKSPPPRRCTIKNSQSKFKSRNRDLTSYRKLSVRRKKKNGKNKPPVPDPSHLEPLYENFDGFDGHVLHDGSEYLDPFDSVYEEIPYEEVLAREYYNTGVGQEEDNYLNSSSNFIKPCDSDSEYEPMDGDGDLYDDAQPFDSASHAKHTYTVNVAEDTTNVPCGLVKRLKNKINESPETSPFQRQGSGTSLGSNSSGGGYKRQDSAASSGSCSSPSVIKNVSTEVKSPRSNNNNKTSSSSSPKNQSLGNRAFFETEKNVNAPVKNKWAPPLKTKAASDVGTLESTAVAKPNAKPRVNGKGDAKMNNGKLVTGRHQLVKRDSDKEILARSGNDPEISTCLDQKLVSRFLKEEVGSSIQQNVKTTPVRKTSNGTSSPRFGQTSTQQAGKNFGSPVAKGKYSQTKVSTLPTAFNQKPKPTPRGDANKAATLASRIAQFEQK